MEDMKVICTYSRQQAVDDGVLVEIPEELKKNAGFKTPVIMTQSVHNLCEVPSGMEGSQDYTGRLWDVLWMAILAFRKAIKKGGDEARLVHFEVIFQNKTSLNGHTTEKLWMVFTEHEGFTIMKPEDY